MDKLPGFIGSYWLAAMALGSGHVLAQTPAEAPSAAVVTDEVIVRGRTGARLRLEIERAQDAVFARFNAINSNDEFDIDCRQEVRMVSGGGSRIPKRVCAPRFLRIAQTRTSRDTVQAMQGSAFAGGGEGYYAGWASYRRAQLEAEMIKLAREDEQLLSALARLMELERARNPPRE